MMMMMMIIIILTIYNTFTTASNKNLNLQKPDFIQNKHDSGTLGNEIHSISLLGYINLPHANLVLVA
jgi:hypothetical protein